MADSDHSTLSPPGVPARAPGPGRARLFTFASGGWVLLIALALTLAIAAWGYLGWLRVGASRIGDGVTLESYRFDLADTLIPREQIIPAGFSKDREVPAMYQPRFISPTEVDRITRDERGKYLVSRDRVIGVVINGEARAYPLNILFVHEIVNDTLGGVPIAVTYHPLCDSIVVFDRRVAGETLEFGVSGLVHNSNLLMFDRRDNDDPRAESLWSQLQARAVAGPAAAEGRVLTLLPARLMHWSEWRSAHPDTSVLAREPDLRRRYTRTYSQYFDSDKLHFPVSPLPPENDPLPLKSAMIVIDLGAPAPGGATGGLIARRLDDLLARADNDGRVVEIIDTVPVEFIVRDGPLVAWAHRLDTGEPLPARWCLRFAWWALLRGE